MEKHPIEYANLAMQRADLAENPDSFNRIMIRDNVGLVLVLRNLTHPRQVPFAALSGDVSVH